MDRNSILKKYGLNVIARDESFANLLKLAKIICDMPIAYISILDNEYQYILSQDGIQLKKMPLEETFCQHTLNQNEILIVEDTRKDNRTKHLPLANQKKSIIFYSGYPLIDDEKNNLGAFCIMDYQTRKLNKKQEEALKALSEQVVKSFNLRKLLINDLQMNAQHSPKEYQKLQDLEHQLIKSKQIVQEKNRALTLKSAQLKTANLKLKKKSKDIEAIIDVIPACISFVDLDYRYQLNNKVYESWFGFTQKELCGKHVKFVLGEEQFNSQLPLFEKVFSGKTVRFEQTMYLKKERHLRVTYLPSYSYLEKVNGAFVFAEDLTDIKNNQEKLELSNRSLESFAYIVSHDIKSPLKTIQSFGNLIKQDLAKKKVVYKIEHLDFMIDSAQRLENLTTDLLSYAKVQNSKHTEDQVCSLQKNLQVVLCNLQATIGESSANINFDKNEIKLKVLQNDLIQLLQNIIGNGIKYQKKQNTPVINISTELQENACKIIIEDNGIGMKEENLDKIFEPFTRVSPDPTYSGTGIGLATCQKIMGKYDSEIEVQSTLGSGSIFSFILPIASCD